MLAGCVRPVRSTSASGIKVGAVWVDAIARRPTRSSNASLRTTQPNMPGGKARVSADPSVDASQTRSTDTASTTARSHAGAAVMPRAVGLNGHQWMMVPVGKRKDLPKNRNDPRLRWWRVAPRAGKPTCHPTDRTRPARPDLTWRSAPAPSHASHQGTELRREPASDPKGGAILARSMRHGRGARLRQRFAIRRELSGLQTTPHAQLRPGRTRPRSCGSGLGRPIAR